MKNCTKCKKLKNLEEFHRATKLKDGRRSECKVCVLGHEPHDKNVSEKSCTLCKTIKPINNFYLNKTTNCYNSNCKKCKNKKRHEKRMETPEIEVIRQRKRTLRNKYGLSYEYYENMLINQNGRCGICKNIMEKPCVDHCHTTDKVRELLCGECNKGIGLLKENIDYLNNAITYLIKHNLPLNRK